MLHLSDTPGNIITYGVPCPVCGQDPTLKSPQRLSCLHYVCLDCTTGKNIITCTRCWRETLVSLVPDIVQKKQRSLEIAELKGKLVSLVSRALARMEQVPGELSGLRNTLVDLQGERDNSRAMLEETYQSYRVPLEEYKNTALLGLEERYNQNELAIEEKLEHCDSTFSCLEQSIIFAKQLMKKEDSEVEQQQVEGVMARLSTLVEQLGRKMDGLQASLEGKPNKGVFYDENDDDYNDNNSSSTEEDGGTNDVDITEQPKAVVFKDISKPKHNIINDLTSLQFGLRMTPSFGQRRCASVDMVKRLKLAYKLSGHEGCVNSLHFNQSGSKIASGSDDLNTIVWEWEKNRKMVQFNSGHKANVFQSKIMPGDLLITSCSRDGQVRLAELSVTGSLRSTKKLGQHKGPAHKMSLLPDCPYVILSAGEDGQVLSVDIREQKPDKILLLKNEKDKKIPIYSIHSSPSDGNMFCTSGRDQYVRIFDRRFLGGAGGQVVKFYPDNLKDNDEFKAYMTYAVFSEDGREVIGSYNDEDIYLFNTTDPEGSPHAHKYQGHRNSATVKGINFYGPNSEYIISGSDCGNIFIWDKQTEGLVKPAVSSSVTAAYHPSSSVVVTSPSLVVSAAADSSQATLVQELLTPSPTLGQVITTPTPVCLSLGQQSPLSPAYPSLSQPLDSPQVLAPQTLPRSEEGGEVDKKENLKPTEKSKKKLPRKKAQEIKQRVLAENDKWNKYKFSNLPSNITFLPLRRALRSHGIKRGICIKELSEGSARVNIEFKLGDKYLSDFKIDGQPIKIELDSPDPDNTVSPSMTNELVGPNPDNDNTVSPPMKKKLPAVFKPTKDLTQKMMDDWIAGCVKMLEKPEIKSSDEPENQPEAGE